MRMRTTIGELHAWLRQTHQVSAGSALICETLALLVLKRKKKLLRASEQGRPDIAAARTEWQDDQTNLDPARLIFIDETWTKTDMTRPMGRAERGKRLLRAVPYGRVTGTFDTSSHRRGSTALAEPGWQASQGKRKICPSTPSIRLKRSHRFSVLAFQFSSKHGSFIMSARLIVSVVLAACFALPFESPRVLAQAATTSTSPSSEVEAHINALRTELAITPAEIPQWNAFAAVMRENAAAMEALYRQRSQNASAMNAVQVLESYRDFAKMHVSDLDQLIPAFAKLYAVLSPEQQKMADALFANRAAHKAGAAP